MPLRRYIDHANNGTRPIMYSTKQRRPIKVSSTEKPVGGSEQIICSEPIVTNIITIRPL
jgi:hypothetical protein